MKRFLSLILALVLSALLLSAAAAEDNTAYGEGDYYVYTENGRGLNVRDTPGGKVVGNLKYGSRVHVDAFSTENWALITYRYNKPGYGMGDYACFVSRRFLTKKKPAPYKRETQTAVQPAADPLSELNAQYRSAKAVTPYQIIVRPSRVSGWVSMHWGPSVDTEVEATYKSGDSLTVLQETDGWLQVEDAERGIVGFVSKRFIEQ